MRIDPAGLRAAVTVLSGAFIIAAAAVVLLNTVPRNDSLEASLWLSGGAFLQLLSVLQITRGSRRGALLFGVLAALVGGAGVAGYLLAYNGLFEAAAYAGFRLIAFTNVHMGGALALLVASLGSIITATRTRHGFGAESLAASGFVTWLLVSALIIGQSLHVVPLEAGALAQRLLTAECVLLLAVAGLLLLSSLVLRNGRFDVRNRFAPVLAFFVLLVASLHLWLVLIGEEQQAIRNQTHATLERLRGALEDHIRERVDALERMGSRIGDPARRRDLWQNDAETYLEDFSSISAIGWIMPDGIVHWAISREDEHYHEGEPYAVDAARRAVIEQARATGRTAFSEPVDLRAEGYGQLVAVPMQENGAFVGWLVVGVRFNELFRTEVDIASHGFAVRIIQDGGVIYSRVRDAEPHPLSRVTEQRLVINNLEWRIQSWPEREFFNRQFLWLPGLLLTLGIIAALLFGFSLYQLETQRRRTARLHEGEERYRLVAEQTGELVYDYHLPSGQIEWAGAIKEITGQSPEEFASVDAAGWENRLHPEDAGYVIRQLQQAEQALDRFQCEYRFRRGDGSYVLVEERGVFLPGPDGKAVRLLGTLADVTQRHEFERQLRHLAHYDQQTGLRNRVWFMEEAVRRAAPVNASTPPLWFVFLDIDRFRAVNETLGHHVGDLLLEAVARRLESVADGSDLARLGGDEFGLCRRGADLDRSAIAAFCDHLKAAFSEPFPVAGHSLFVTLSMGVASFPQDGADVQQVIRAAETAMFRAKYHGRNTYAFYETAMSAGARENLEIANALRRALERNEFHLVFQPRYSLNTGRVTGMEALLRWESAELGPVQPAQFIPVAEETGLIGPIGWYVVEAAAAAARRLGPELMLGRRIAINVSARQLVYTDFVAELVQRVEAAGATPHWFEIELTESVMLEDSRRARELFGRLHAAGFMISIDDFGTGYSSLNYLKHFPVDHLKIDRSFVTGLPGNSDDAAIVRTIIRMGQGLGLKLIAEGIETEAQGEFLREAGCQEAQGFLFARPMMLAQLTVLLE